MIKNIAIPARNKKKVIQETGGVCAFCGEKDVATLEFHHIHGRDITDPHNLNKVPSHFEWVTIFNIGYPTY